MRGWIPGVAALLLAMTPAYAQQQLSAQQQSEADQIKARQRISMMEGVLERAVSNGAESMMRQFKTVSPELPMLTGLPEARGFRLDGYGVFFDVEVPALRLPVTWPLRMLYRDSTNRVIDDLRPLMVDLDPRLREQILQVVRRDQSGSNVFAASSPGPDAVVAPQRDPANQAIDDPEVRYTQEVKSALVDAMIENSLPLSLGADEWLTIAARDNVPHDPLIPGDKADFSTVIFRVKGSDLGAYRAGRITIDDVRKKVEIREY
ncbi:MAG TPA: hypothetical protein VGF24_25155 [Vicinamibacterales bacterium]|jgi:hypothetical protein